MFKLELLLYYIYAEPHTVNHNNAGLLFVGKMCVCVSESYIHSKQVYLNWFAKAEI